MLQALEAGRAHPIGLALHFRDLLDNFAVQSSFRLEGVVFGYMESGTIRILFYLIYLTHSIDSICWLLSRNIHTTETRGFLFNPYLSTRIYWYYMSFSRPCQEKVADFSQKCGYMQERDGIALLHVATLLAEICVLCA